MTYSFIAPARRSLSVVPMGNHTLPKRNGDTPPLKGRAPPAKPGVAHPVKEGTPPVKEGKPPVKDVPPVKEDVSPIKESVSPIKEDVAPNEDIHPVEAEIASRPSSVVDPAYIQKRYGLPSEPATASPSHSLFIAARADDVANPTDLQVCRDRYTVWALLTVIHATLFLRPSWLPNVQMWNNIRSLMKEIKTIRKLSERLRGHVPSNSASSSLI